MKEEEKKMYCGNCGIQNDDRAMFCQNCGAKLEGSESAAICWIWTRWSKYRISKYGI